MCPKWNYLQKPVFIKSTSLPSSTKLGISSQSINRYFGHHLFSIKPYWLELMIFLSFLFFSFQLKNCGSVFPLLCLELRSSFLAYGYQEYSACPSWTLAIILALFQSSGIFPVLQDILKINIYRQGSPLASSFRTKECKLSGLVF